MNPDQEHIVNELESQLTTNPRLLVLGLKDWLAYEKMVAIVGDTFLGVQMNPDSPVPLTYKTVPVIMRPGDVKDLIKELVSRDRPVPSVAPPINSGGVKPMTQAERAMEEPEQKRKGELIESLTDNPDWWNGDQIITEEAQPPAANGATNASPPAPGPSV